MQGKVLTRVFLDQGLAAYSPQALPGAGQAGSCIHIIAISPATWLQPGAATSQWGTKSGLGSLQLHPCCREGGGGRKRTREMAVAAVWSQFPAAHSQLSSPPAGSCCPAAAWVQGAGRSSGSVNALPAAWPQPGCRQTLHTDDMPPKPPGPGQTGIGVVPGPGSKRLPAPALHCGAAATGCKAFLALYTWDNFIFLNSAVISIFNFPVLWIIPEGEM